MFDGILTAFDSHADWILEPSRGSTTEHNAASPAVGSFAKVFAS